MFELKKVMARDVRADEDDTANIKFALTSLGYYDDSETGLSSFVDDKLFHSVKDFQSDNNLKVDGVIKPDGPTQSRIREHLLKDERAGNAFTDFKNNFDLMNEARTQGADKYFHCKANYEASSRGWAGELVAKTLSNAKEIKDQYYTGHPIADSDEDQKANMYGRNAAQSGGFSSSQEACSIFRPAELDEKY